MLTLPCSSMIALQARGLGVDVERELGQEDGVDVPALARQADAGTHSCVSSHLRYSAAAAAVSQPQCRPMTSCTMSMRGPERCSPMMFAANPAASSAAVHAPSDCLIGHDVVVDRLGQADDRQVVAVLVQVRGEVRRGRVRVVAADGVQHVDAVGLELLGRDLQRVLALLDEAALDAVRRRW